MKTCNVCKIAKPLEDFHKASKSPDGRQYRCKECSVSASRQWAKDNPGAKRENDKRYIGTDGYKAKRKARREGPQRERILEQKRESWYRNHDSNLEKLRQRHTDPEFRRKQRERRAKWRASDPRGAHRHNLKSFYGMTLEEWDMLVTAQLGRCAICNTPGDLVIDHCHEAGHIRALLCAICNLGLGHFRDDPARLRAAAAYIEMYRRN